MPPQQDIPPTAPTAPTATDTSPSLIEPPTAISTDTDNTNNNNDNDPPDDDDDDNDDDTYGNYAYDSLDEYNDYAYDDDDDDDENDDDDSFASSSSDEDEYSHHNNTPNVIFDMHGNQFNIDANDVLSYADDDDKPITIQAAQRQMNAILAGHTTTSSIEDFTNQAKREYDGFFLPNKNANRTVPATPFPAPTTYAKNDNHDAFLYNRWNKTNTNKNTTTISPSTTKPTAAAATIGKTTAYAPIEIPVKDDTSVTPTLETLCTLDTRTSHPTNIDNDTILSITIWNQPIVQYQVPIQPNTPVLLYSML